MVANLTDEDFSPLTAYFDKFRLSHREHDMAEQGQVISEKSFISIWNSSIFSTKPPTG